MTQLALGSLSPPPRRVRALAGVLAGFAYPGHGSFEKMPKLQQEVALRVAEDALVTLAAVAPARGKG